MAAGGSALVLCGLCLGSAVWLHSAMDDEYARGEVFGRAVSVAEAAREIAALRASADAALLKTNAEIAALEDEREQLQEGLDGLARESISNDGAVCVGPGLVRAHAAVGRAGRGVQPRP